MRAAPRFAPEIADSGPLARVSDVYYKETMGTPRAAPLTDLASQIQRQIKRRGWTYVDFARELGQAPCNVSRWCTGRVRPNLASLQRIAEVLGVRVDTLLAPVDEGEGERRTGS